MAAPQAAEQERLRAQQRAAETAAELEECTFTPLVTVRSGELMEARAAAMRRAGLTAHSTLFAEQATRAGTFETTFVDEELRVSRGAQGELRVFVRD